ncbi:MAG: septum formation initiator family protein, partial [bacterium]|nr:septum formation initiator family protein [bacterium]
MRELQEKQKIKRKIYSLPSLIALLILCTLLIKGAYGVVEKQVESAQRVSELEAKVQALRERSLELEANIGRLDTEEGLIEEIKEKFSVTREGEQVAIIVDQIEPDSATLPQEKSWFKRLW